MTYEIVRQPAFYARDDWPRGVNYRQRLTITDCDDEPVDFTGWSTLEIAAEGSEASKPVGVGLVSVSFLAEEDGLHRGILLVSISNRVFELDRPDDALADNTFKYTVQARSTSGQPRVVAQCSVRIIDTAFI